MVGIVAPGLLIDRTPRLAGPRFITMRAEVRLDATARGRPEWMPTAAKSSGWVAARMAAIAPPAESPAT